MDILIIFLTLFAGFALFVGVVLFISKVMPPKIKDNVETIYTTVRKKVRFPKQSARLS